MNSFNFNLSDKTTLYTYLILAFIFSFLIHSIWIWLVNDNPSFFWNNQYMINTNDGYYWAEGARDILNGTYEEGRSSPVCEFISKLTAFFVYLLPFKFETIILFMPPFLSSLIVIPMILIGRSLGNVSLGFIAALLSSVAWSYYNRTMVGYYDTDMLNIVFPALLVWSLIKAFQTKEKKYILIMALDIILYRAWYPQSYSLEFAFFGLLFLYFIIYERKNLYVLQLLTLLLLSMVNLPMAYRIVLVLLYYMLLNRKLSLISFRYILVSVFTLFLLTGGFDPIWLQLKGYVFSDTTLTTKGDLNLHFFSVMQTISEAGKIPFERFADRISGHTILFLLSTVGYLLFVIRFRVMLLTLPLVGLGFMAYGLPGLVSGGGLRFTIYAVIPMSLGLAYIIIEASKFISDQVKDKRKAQILNLLIIAFFVSFALYPNIKHAQEYAVPTVMNKQEVETLAKLQSISSRNDYVIAWWDYGYPVRYYADVNTLADGGVHSGKVNYPVSLALTKPQDISAKVSRMSVEVNEMNFKANKEKTYFISLFKKKEKKKDHFTSLLQENNISSVEEYYDFMEYMPIESLPKKTRDIYYYLPFRMTSIFPVVESFRKIDIFTGEKQQGSMFRAFPFQNLSDRFQLANGLYFSKRDGNLYQGNKAIPLRMFYQSAYNKDGKLEIKKQLLNMTSKINLLLLPNYGQIILLDDEALNSTYVQLFFFENYDERFFEPVVLSPVAKIYKSKI